MSESLKQQIDRLEELYKSELDPRGRAFVPLADAHRRLGDLDQALTVIQEGLGAHPDFASAHLVRGWVHRGRQEPEDAMRSFERVLALDAENSFARAAIAELIDDQRAQAYGDRVATKAPDAPAAEGERSVVPIASLAPGALAETVVPIASLAPGAPVQTVVPIASLAPGVPVETVVPIASLAPADTVTAPDAVDGRPVVPIASLAPGASVDTVAASDATPESAPDGGRAVVPIASLAPVDVVDEVVGDLVGERDVVPIPSLAPEGGAGEAIQASDGDGPIDGEIYTQTLGELYAVQGATEKAIEVYGKLIADDPDNEALRTRLNALESLDSGADGAPAQLDVRAGLGPLGIGADQRQTVSIESLAPEGNG